MSYLNKSQRTELSDLSQKVFGTRSKWQYFYKERGYSYESLKEQMLILAKQVDEVMNEETKKQISEITTGRVLAGGMGTRKPSREIRRKYLRRRNKARRKEAAPKPVASGSLDGDNTGS